MSAAIQAREQPLAGVLPAHGDVTMLELVAAVAETASDDREIVATVLHMLRSGSVRLCGTFRDECLESFES